MIKVNDNVKVLKLSSFRNTTGGQELLDEIFTVSSVDKDGILLEDCNEVVLDEIFSEQELQLI